MNAKKLVIIIAVVIVAAALVAMLIEPGFWNRAVAWVVNIISGGETSAPTDLFQ